MMSRWSGFSRNERGARGSVGTSFLCVSAFLWLLQSPQLPPGVEIKIEAQPRKALVGDPIRIDLELTLPQSYQFRLPMLESPTAEFTILEPFTDVTVSEGENKKEKPPADGRIRHRKRATVALYKVGEFEFPPLQLSLRSPEGKETVAATQPLKIHIQSVLSEKEQNLKDLKKQAEIPDPVNWILWLAVLLVLLAVAAGVWWWWQRRRRPALPVPEQLLVDPLASAEADLHDLLARRWLENGFVKQFYVALSDIVKKILESGYGIHTLEKTTPEVMENLREQRAGASTQDLASIESLLIHCDLVKFAKYVPSKTETENAVKDAFQILDACKRSRALPAAPAAEPLAGVP
jgi:hypothetical protein